MLHRNTPQRYYVPGGIYFITTKTSCNYKYFREPVLCELLMENLIICKELKQFRLYAFCLTYDHLHLLLQPCDKYDISKVMHNLKMNLSRNINKVIDYKDPVGEDTYPHLRGNNYPKFKWQRGFYDHVIRDEKDFENHYRYTVYNFKKHGLLDNWEYTSLNFPELIQ
jgi:REP element-mobilizing transposase RayT